MRKTYIHFEKVPVEVAEKILKQQDSTAKHNGNRKLAGKKSKKTATGPSALPKELEGVKT